MGVTIDKKRYSVTDYYKTKAEAQKEAKRLRKAYTQMSVRVIKRLGRWAVATRWTK